MTEHKKFKPMYSKKIEIRPGRISTTIINHSLLIQRRNPLPSREKITRVPHIATLKNAAPTGAFFVGFFIGMVPGDPLHPQGFGEANRTGR